MLVIHLFWAIFSSKGSSGISEYLILAISALSLPTVSLLPGILALCLCLVLLLHLYANYNATDVWKGCPRVPSHHFMSHGVMGQPDGREKLNWVQVIRQLWFSKSGPWGSCICITWELMRCATSISEPEAVSNLFLPSPWVIPRQAQTWESCLYIRERIRGVCRGCACAAGNLKRTEDRILANSDRGT